MNRFILGMTCLLIVSVAAEKKKITSGEPNSFKLEEPESEKLFEKERPTSNKSGNNVVLSNKFKRAGIIAGGTTNSDRERAVEEKSLADYIPYDTIQNIILKIFKPQAPVLDTASAGEKNAKNNGNGAEPLGDFVVKGSETVFRALNSVLEIPKKALSKLSVGATQTLNQIGAYIVGL